MLCRKITCSICKLLGDTDSDTEENLKYSYHKKCPKDQLDISHQMASYWIPNTLQLQGVIFAVIRDKRRIFFGGIFSVCIRIHLVLKLKKTHTSSVFCVKYVHEFVIMTMQFLWWDTMSLRRGELFRFDRKYSWTINCEDSVLKLYKYYVTIIISFLVFITLSMLWIRSCSLNNTEACNLLMFTLA